MTEHSPTPRTGGLSDLLTALQAARIDAACNRWHLDKRALRPLEALADGTGESRLHQLITAASEQFDAARDALAKAIALVESRMRADGQLSQST